MWKGLKYPGFVYNSVLYFHSLNIMMVHTLKVVSDGKQVHYHTQSRPLVLIKAVGEFQFISFDLIGYFDSVGYNYVRK